MLIKFVAPTLAALGAVAALATGPVANAESGGCEYTGGATVCSSPGSSRIYATPPATGLGGGGLFPFGFQNGPFGPSGVLAPVGGN